MKQYGKVSAITLVALAILASPILAQPQLLMVSTGVEAGTYARFFNEIARVCPQPPLQAIASRGSLENLERLLNNDANLAFVQADVLFAKKLDNDPDVDNVRTFLVLYPEEVHILIKSSNNYIGKFSDLGNKKVAVYGGSVVTSRVLFAKTGVRPTRVQTFSGPKEAMQALGKEVDAVLGVGGKPLAWVKELDDKYKLVPFDLPSKVNEVYAPAVLSYSNLEQTGGVRTVAVPSVLVTMNYKTPKVITPLLQLRSCIINNLDTLRETVGNHPKWRLVDPNNKGPWPYFEATIPAPVPAPKK